MIQFPESLKKGDIVDITATSWGITGEKDEKKLAIACRHLRDRGYQIRETANVRTNRKQVSSGAKERTEQFMELWKTTR